ncbi:MAG: DUF2004 domain-containing protein [Marinifilaceae bacterium]
MKKEITYFGDIDITTPKKSYEGHIKIENHEVKLGLVIENKPENDNWADLYNCYAKRLLTLKPEMDKALKQNYDEERQASDYIDFMLEQLDDNVIANLVEDEDDNKPIEERMFATMQLMEIDFYPAGDNFAKWRYTLGKNVTDRAVNIYTNTEGIVQYIARDEH